MKTEKINGQKTERYDEKGYCVDCNAYSWVDGESRCEDCD